MSKQAYRHTSGGHINRNKPIHFTFDGVGYEGFEGDTLASALLANGVRVVGRSFKYHRPRGVFGFGVEEPNALVHLRTGERLEPNLRATQVELYDGLTATSQNRWPSIDFDVGQVNNTFSKFLPAGFYYKTFMWPAAWWMRYEHFIRRAAGLGNPPTESDPDSYSKRYAHCDVLVIGGGPAGLMAATSAERSGARVMIVDENANWGGGLRGQSNQDGNALQWMSSVINELESASSVRMLNRTTAFGYYDQNLIAVCERVADHVSRPAAHQPRQRIWWVRAKQVVLATGAIERPIVFAQNDVPGVMLASAVKNYALQHGVKCGKRAVVFTNNNSAYETVAALRNTGVEVAAVVDSRQAGEAGDVNADLSGVEVLHGHVVVGMRGTKQVSAVNVMQYDGQNVSGESRRIECDLLCVSGGWNPTVHLFSQSQGKLRFDDDIAAFVPGESRQAERSVGACKGTFSLADCLDEGLAAGRGSSVGCGLRIRQSG